MKCITKIEKEGTFINTRIENHVFGDKEKDGFRKCLLCGLEVKGFTIKKLTKITP